MKKLLLPILLILSSLNADTTTMSEEDMINEIIKMEKQIQKSKKRKKEARAKTKAIKKLGRTVDKLAKTLGVD